MQLNLSSSSFASLLASMCLLLTSESGFAQYFAGGFPSSRVVQVRWAAPSLSSDYLTKYVRPGVNSWNGISSRVSISQVATSTSGSYEIDVLTSSTPRQGLVGQLIPYYLIGSKLFESSPTDTWTYAQLFGYTNQISNFKLTDSEIIASVYAHEMGHALSMAHTNPPTGTISIMKSGFQTSYLPQAFDKANLKAKWGN
jgi:hypothetical protein